MRGVAFGAPVQNDEAGFIARPQTRSGALSPAELDLVREVVQAARGEFAVAVTYADPGYQPDGKQRYPLDTEKHVRAAWAYIHMPKNQTKYSADQVSKIEAAIKAAGTPYDIEFKDGTKGSWPCGHGDQFATAAGDEGNQLKTAQELRSALIALVKSEIDESDEEPRLDRWSISALLDAIAGLESFIANEQFEVEYGAAALATAARSKEPSYQFACPSCGESVVVRPVHKLQVVQHKDAVNMPDEMAEKNDITEVSEAGDTPAAPVLPDELLRTGATASQEAEPMPTLAELTEAITATAAKTASETAAATVAATLAALGITPSAGAAIVAEAGGVPPQFQKKDDKDADDKDGTADAASGEPAGHADDPALPAAPKHANESPTNLVGDGANTLQDATGETATVAAKDGGNDGDEDDAAAAAKADAAALAALEAAAQAEAAAAVSAVAGVTVPDATDAARATLAALAQRAPQGTRASYRLDRPEDIDRWVGDMAGAHLQKQSQVGLANLGQFAGTGLDRIRAARAADPAVAVAAQTNVEVDANAITPPSADPFAGIFMRR